MMTGSLAPDSGTVKLGVNLEILVLDQKRETLDPDWTLGEALSDGSGDMVAVGDSRKHVMAYMKDFLFAPEQVRTPIHALSGGERGRLMLARGLRLPSNLLVLDEPTNDLDLETLDLLQEMIADYHGTVIVVSHDRDFLDRVTTSVIASSGDGQWQEYVGGYSDMQVQRGGVSPVSAKQKAGTDKQGQSKEVEAKPIVPPKGKLSYKHKFALENLPQKIEKLNEEISRINAALAGDGLFERQPAKFQSLVSRLAEVEKERSDAEDEWLELEILREELEG
jgi:ATP-binding cassette subfamily F protein uup